MRFTTIWFTCKVTVCQCFILGRGNQTLGVHFAHFHYIKWPTSRCTTRRQIIPAAPVSLSVSWISGLSGSQWCMGALPLPAYLFLSFSLSPLLHSLSLLWFYVSGYFILTYASRSALLFPSIFLSLLLCSVSLPSLLLPLIESSLPERALISVYMA